MELPRGTLIEHLKKDSVEVSFTKVDGAPRVMNCTLDPGVIPVVNITSESNRKENPDVLVVWDLDKSAWRSFRFDSVNKFVAKIASDINKPNGQKTIPPNQVQSFIDDLPIEKFYGVGKVTKDKMYRLGIFYGRDLKSKSIGFLETHFKNAANYYYQLARGIHNTPVQSSRSRKSVGVEHTHEKNIPSEILLLPHIKKLSFEISKRLLKNQLKGKTITLKIKFSDFSIQTRSHTLENFTNEPGLIFKTCSNLLKTNETKESIRLSGISISNLDNQKNGQIPQQLTLDF